MREKAFVLPSHLAERSDGFDWVFDFTGEKHDSPDEVASLAHIICAYSTLAETLCCRYTGSGL